MCMGGVNGKARVVHEARGAAEIRVELRKEQSGSAEEGKGRRKAKVTKKERAK